MTKKTIIIAAGGTGGHLYPAEALTQELLNRGHKVIIITDKRGTAFQKLGNKIHIDCIKAATFRAGFFSKIKSFITIGIGIFQAILLIFKYKPSAVIGFGGYPSFPTVFAAQLLKTRTILHEQNAVLGKANLWLANGADTIATSLPNTKGISVDNKKKTKVTGNPVRADICAVRDLPYPSLEDNFKIFITGGSQAAEIFSKVIPAAVKTLPEDIKKTLSVVHQCKKYDIEATVEKYNKANVKAEVKSFFDDMPEKLSQCHLFIGRSGASTVSEIAIVGRPAIFIPYPGHVDQQQKYNAEIISNNGGAWIIEQNNLSPNILSKKIEFLVKNLDTLEKSALKAKSCGKPEAVKNLADLVEEILTK